MRTKDKNEKEIVPKKIWKKKFERNAGLLISFTNVIK